MTRRGFRETEEHIAKINELQAIKEAENSRAQTEKSVAWVKDM
jgi:hypothetical protein